MVLDPGPEAKLQRLRAMVERGLEDQLQRVRLEGHGEVVDLCQHIVLAGGKRLRPVLCLLAYEVSGGADAIDVLGLALAFELIHTATLVHDDLNDGVKTRRGVATLHERHGSVRAVIAGDFLFVLGFELGGQAGADIVRLVAHACASIASAELIQLRHIGDLATRPEDYYSIIAGKTAASFAAGCRASALLADASPEVQEALATAGLQLGLAFQIVDDLLDLTGDERLGKPRGTDVLEGKMTLPIIHALTLLHGTPRRRLAEVIEDFHAGLQDELMALLQQAGSLEYAGLLVDGHLDRARAAFLQVPDSPSRAVMLDLLDEMRHRHE